MIAQILAVVIFIAMFVLIVLEVWERHVITLGCGLLTLVLYSDWECTVWVQCGRP